MQNILKQLKQNFDIENFTTYKNCMGNRVYSFTINGIDYMLLKELSNNNLYELGYYMNSDFIVNRYLTKQDVIRCIK